MAEDGNRMPTNAPGPQKTFDGVNTERLVDAENMAENFGPLAGKMTAEENAQNQQNGSPSRKLRQRRGSPTRTASPLRDVTGQHNSPVRARAEEAAEKAEIEAMVDASSLDSLIDGVTPQVTPMRVKDETEEEDSGMTYKRLFELRSRIGKSMTTFQKEFKERKKTVKVGIKKMQSELDQPNEARTNFRADVQTLRDQMERVQGMVEESAREGAQLDAACTELRGKVNTYTKKSDDTLAELRESLENEASVRRQLLGEKEDLEREMRALGEALAQMTEDLSDNERVAREHSEALGCQGMQGNHVLRRELASLEQSEETEDMKKIQTQIDAESRSAANSQKALDAKLSDKVEVEEMVAALEAKKSKSDDQETNSAIDSELECARSRLRMVNSACSAVQRCIEQHNARIDKFNGKLLKIRTCQQTRQAGSGVDSLGVAIIPETPREMLTSQVNMVTAESSIMASSISVQEEIPLFSAPPVALSEETLAEQRMEELESTLESKQGLLSELEEWCEQLKAKVEKMHAEEAETGEDLKDEIATMNDELEAVQMKMKSHMRTVQKLEKEISDIKGGS